LQVWTFDAKLMDTTRPTWFPAQVAVDAQTDFRIILEGQAMNGGFAVDDLMFSPGSCSSELIFCDKFNVDEVSNVVILINRTIFPSSETRKSCCEKSRAEATGPIPVAELQSTPAQMP
jgi:hypothetical protein